MITALRASHRVRALVAVLLGAVAVFTVIAIPAPAAADVDDFTFDRMSVVYELDRADDGTSTVTVTETLVAVFPEFDQNRGIRRGIPDSYQGVPLFPHLVSVTDENGAPRPAEVDSDEGTFWVTSRADDYLYGEQTYVITYELENVIGAFRDTGADEFYWDINGLGWGQPFGLVEATVVLPSDLADQLTGQMGCYQGSIGSGTSCEISVEPRADGADVYASAEDLGPYQTLTIAVGFEPGTFTPYDTSYFASPWAWLQTTVLAGAVGILVWSFILRRRHLRDEPGRPTIIAEYDPPSSADALESAVLLHKSSKAIPAEVLEQAVVGSIRLLEKPRRWGKPQFVAELVDASLADRDGRMLLDGLFGPGAPAGSDFVFGTTDKQFSAAARRILLAAARDLKARGMYRSVPARYRVVPVLSAFGALALVLGFGIGTASSGRGGGWPILAIVVAAFIAVVTSIVLSKKPLTAAGAELRDHLAGLKVFIEWAEADRIRMLQSPEGAERRRIDVGDDREMLHLYETLLPYAVVFGQEKQWAERLAAFYEQHHSRPTWYYGAAGFSAASFASSMGSLSSTAMSSSSSGGSSGGGSAGGGGGGGGGGGV